MTEAKWLVVPVALLALVLLSIGVNRDHRLKHDDISAMHATFAHNHLAAGLRATRAHDAFANPRTGHLKSRAHHPSGCGLVLVGAFTVTERPLVVRGVAIAATLLTLLKLWHLVRREAGPRAALLNLPFQFAVRRRKTTSVPLVPIGTFTAVAVPSGEISNFDRRSSNRGLEKRKTLPWRWCTSVRTPW